LSQGTATYTYSENGELLTKTDGGQTTYNYDVLGNLTSVTLPDATLIEYIIDAWNRRIGKKVNGTLERAWLYKDGLHPVAELNGSGAVVSRFVYSSKNNIPDFIIKGGVTYRIISDNLGSPRLVVDTTTGIVAQTMDFDELGNLIADTSPEFQPFGFAGGLYDSDTGLVRFGARDYDPETGRWTNKDPIRFAGGDTNLYGYVLNDPINLVDLSGLLNRVKLGVGVFNLGNAVRLTVQGVGLTAAGLVVSIVGGPVPATPLFATAFLKFNSARTTAIRASKQLGESINEDFCEESLKNLLGLFPFGDKFDDDDEPSPFEADLLGNTSILDISGELLSIF
jgi:RHS repeat-associated protein